MRIKMEKEIKVTAAGIKKVVDAPEVSKSQKMKELFGMGLRIKEIAEHMDVRYNFAYNVITNHININGIEVVKSEKKGKKDDIIALFKEGKTNTEISKELRTNYNYVYKVLKDYKMVQEAENKATKEATGTEKEATGTTKVKKLEEAK